MLYYPRHAPGGKAFLCRRGSAGPSSAEKLSFRPGHGRTYSGKAEEETRERKLVLRETVTDSTRILSGADNLDGPPCRSSFPFSASRTSPEDRIFPQAADLDFTDMPRTGCLLKMPRMNVFPLPQSSGILSFRPPSGVMTPVRETETSGNTQELFRHLHPCHSAAGQPRTFPVRKEAPGMPFFPINS